MKRTRWFDDNDKRAQSVLREMQSGAVAQRRLMQRGVAGVDPAFIAGLIATLKQQRVRGPLRLGAPVPGIGPLRLPTSGLTTSFKAEILDGIHLAADTYKIALYVAASTIGPSSTAYTATNEVANGNGYTTGGVTLAGRQVVTDTGVAILDWTTDPVWAAASITARGAMIYNSTRSNKSVAVFDFGADITSTNGNFTVTLPSPTAAAGAIRIA